MSVLTPAAPQFLETSIGVRRVANLVQDTRLVDADGNLVGSSGGIPVIATPTSGTVTDRSGTITSGGTAQQVMAANASRKYLFFQNNSDTDCWINFGATAVANQPSIKIAAGASYENPPHFCPNGLVSVIGATTGKTFTAKEA